MFRMIFVLWRPAFLLMLTIWVVCLVIYAIWHGKPNNSNCVILYWYSFFLKIFMHQSVKITDAIWLFTADNLFHSHSSIGQSESTPHWDSNRCPHLDRRTTYQLSYPSPFIDIVILSHHVTFTMVSGGLIPKYPAADRPCSQNTLLHRWYWYIMNSNRYKKHYITINYVKLPNVPL